MYKKQVLCVGLLLTLLTVICQEALGQQTGSYAGRTLKVATWGGAWREIREKLVAQPFEKATGAKVEWVLGNPVDHLAKMIAARGGEPPFDVAEFGSIETAQAREIGLLDKIDRNLAPNIRKTVPGVVGQDYANYFAIEFVNMYLPSKFKELGISPPTRLEDLFQPKLAGKVSLPYVGASVMGPYFLVSLAINKGGSLTNIEPALDILGKAKVSYYYRSTSELEMRMFAGEIWAAYGSITRAYLNRVAGKDMDYASVGVGSKKVTNNLAPMVIVKGTKNRELAHLFLDYSLALDAQYGMAEWGGVRPVTEEGLKKVLASSNANLRRIAEVPWKDVFTFDFPPDIDIAAKNVGKWVDQFDRKVGAR